jgi:hypothetical protein
VIAPTPHFVHVDDGIYIVFFDIVRIEHAVAATIEAIFILLAHQTWTNGRILSPSTSSKTWL